jgi:hypothetical protein
MSEVSGGLGLAIKNWWSSEMKGVFGVTSGDVTEGILGGTKFTHTLGPQNTLACNPLLQLLGFAAGEPYAASGPLMDLLLGLGTHVDFVYGKKIGYTFGGPHVDITRGVNLHLQTRTAYGWRGPWPALAPEDPMEEMHNQAVKMSDPMATRLVALLGQILNITQTMLELWIRLKYEKIKEHTGELSLNEVKPSEGLEALQKSASLLPSRLMALIYYLELGTALKALGQRMLQFGKNALTAGWEAGVGLFQFIGCAALLAGLLVAIPVTATVIAAIVVTREGIAFLRWARAGLSSLSDGIEKAWKNLGACGQAIVVVLLILAILLPALLVKRS